MKNWLRDNPWLGPFLIVTGGLMLIALVLLFLAKSKYDDALASLNTAAAERNRLEHLNPFPNEENYKKMQNLIGAYSTSLDEFQKEISRYVLPEQPLAPNEFQSRLRRAINVTVEKARFNKVKLPDRFFLGFDEFTSTLPNPAAAPLLGQELSQIQLLINMLIDARVDGLTEIRRKPLLEESSLTATATAIAGRQQTTPSSSVQRSIVDLTFTAASSAARKALNQIASNNDQLFVIRTLHVRSQQEKGPPREIEGRTILKTQPTAPKQPGAINFIVGNEHVEVSARVEMVHFTFN